MPILGSRMIKARLVYTSCAMAVIGVLSGAAVASPYFAAWQAFQLRCLAPFERFAPAQTEDLIPVVGREGAFQLSKGAILVVGAADEMGARSCTVEGAGLIKGYREWQAAALQTGKYRETETPGLWMSHEWIEPRIIVEKTPGAIRVVESCLES